MPRALSTFWRWASTLVDELPLLEAAVDAVAVILRFLAALPIGQNSRAGESGKLRETEKPGKLRDLLADLLQRLYDLYPMLSDHYFSHQARVVDTTAAAAERAVGR